MDFNTIFETYRIKEETFKVSIPEGEFEFTNPPDYSAVLDQEKRVEDVMKIADNPPPTWAGNMPASREVTRMAIYLSGLCISPKWDHLFWLKLAKHCGALIPTLFQHVSEKLEVKASTNEQKKLEDLKNESADTSNEETGSSSPETCSESTPIS